jgi:hypothetical protein
VASTAINSIKWKLFTIKQKCQILLRLSNHFHSENADDFYPVLTSDSGRKGSIITVHIANKAKFHLFK